jgi:hypothetical protein
MTHVDDATLAQLRDGDTALTPAAVLEVDDHLASCEMCRARFAAVIAAGGAPPDSEGIAALMPFAAEVEAYRSGRRRAIERVAAGLAAAIVVATGVWWLSENSRPGGGAAVMAAVDAARSLDAQGHTARDSAWIVDALRGAPLRGLSATEASRVAEEVRRDSPNEHLLIGALEEQAGDRARAALEYRALLAEHPGSSVAEKLLARVAGHP